MKSKLTALFGGLLVLFLGVGQQPAIGNDIPILTWEQGKLQNVVLGGGSSRTSWEVELVGEKGIVAKLKPSARNSQNFIVFSLVLPRDIPLGAYTLQTKGIRADSSTVGVVNIVKQRTYELGRVPGDLVFVFLFLILATSFILAFSKTKIILQYLTSVSPRERFLNGEPTESFIQGVHEISKLERIRLNFQQKLPEGIIIDAVKSNGSIVHFTSTHFWSFLPYVMLFLSGISAADSPIPLVITLMLLCFFGNLDIFSGVLATAVYVIITMFRIDLFSFSSVLGNFFLGCLFFFPSLLVQLYSATANGKARRFDFISITLASMTVHFLVLLQRSLLPDSGIHTAQELLFIVSIILALTISDILEYRVGKTSERNLALEEIYVETKALFSRSGIILISILVFGTFYAWSLSLKLSVLAAALAVLPFIASQFQLNRFSFSWLIKIPRKPYVEVSIVCVMTSLIIYLLTKLPLVTYSIMDTLFIIGFLPVLIYSIYIAMAGTWQSQSEESAK